MHGVMAKPVPIAPTGLLHLLEGAPIPLPPLLMLQHASYALQHTFTVNGSVCHPPCPAVHNVL